MTQGAPAPSVAQRMIAADGSEVYLTPEDAARAYRAGLADFAAGDTAYVRDDVGDLHQVDAATAAARLGGTYTAGLGSELEAAQQQEARDFDTLGRKAEAFGIGAGNALTLGFGKGLAVDLAAAEDKEATRRYLEAQERQNPGYMTAGELAGIAAPALLSGGTAAAARGAVGGAEAVSTLGRGAELLGTVGRAATAPTRALGALAEGIGGVGTAALGEGVLGRAASAAIRGGVEMVPYSVGEAYSRARIEDKDLTAEHLLAAAGHGALMGGAFGGSLSLAGSGLGAALRGSGKLAEAAAPKIQELAEKVGVGIPSAGKIEQEQILKVLAGSNGKRIVKEIAEWSPDLQARLTNMVQKDVPKALERDSLIGATRGEIAKALGEVKSAYGKEYGAVIRDLDAAVTKHAVGDVVAKDLRPSMDAVVERARAEVLSPLIEALPSWERGKAREIDKIVRGLAEDATKAGAEGATFEALNRTSQALRKGIIDNPSRLGGLTLEERALNDARIGLRKIVEDEFTRAGEKVAGLDSAELATRWANAKANYKAAATAETLAKEGAAAEAKNNTVGLGAMLSGGTAANVGAGVGGTIAGPAGAIVGGAIGSLVGTVGGVAIKSHANQVAATIARRAIESDTVRAVTQTIEGTNAAKITDFLKRKTPNLAPVVAEVERVEGRQKRSAQREYEERHRALVAFRTAPDAVLARTLSNAPEEIRQQLGAKTVQVAEYLASKAPAPIGGNPLMPQADPGRVDPAARDRWLRRARAADDPNSVLDDMRAGKLTRDAAETVRDLYPRLYGQITGQIMGELATRKEPLSFAQSQQLHVLLGVPVDVSQAPAYVSAVQHSTPPPVPRTARIEASADASTSMTGSQKLTEEKQT